MYDEKISMYYILFLIIGKFFNQFSSYFHNSLKPGYNLELDLWVLYYVFCLKSVSTSDIFLSKSSCLSKLQRKYVYIKAISADNSHILLDIFTFLYPIGSNLINCTSYFKWLQFKTNLYLFTKRINCIMQSAAEQSTWAQPGP